MNVPRWVCAHGNSQMIEEPTGNYVHISDHLAAVDLAKRDALKAARDAVVSQQNMWSEETLTRMGIGIAIAAIDEIDRSDI